MHPPDPPTIHLAASPPWHELPAQAKWAFACRGALTGLPLALGGRLLDSILALPGHWVWMLGFAALGVVLGIAWGLRRYRYTRWRLQPTSLDLRRGRLWQSDVLVPINRVQHLDLLRGPLDRHLGLASLVVHTAGSRHNTVTLDGLAEPDAQRLRDLLANQAGLNGSTYPVDPPAPAVGQTHMTGLIGTEHPREPS